MIGAGGDVKIGDLSQQPGDGDEVMKQYESYQYFEDLTQLNGLQVALMEHHGVALDEFYKAKASAQYCLAERLYSRKLGKVYECDEEIIVNQIDQIREKIFQDFEALYEVPEENAVVWIAGNMLSPIKSLSQCLVEARQRLTALQSEYSREHLKGLVVKDWLVVSGCLEVCAVDPVRPAKLAIAEVKHFPFHSEYEKGLHLCVEIKKADGEIDKDRIIVDDNEGRTNVWVKCGDDISPYLSKRATECMLTLDDMIERAEKLKSIYVDERIDEKWLKSLVALLTVLPNIIPDQEMFVESISQKIERVKQLRDQLHSALGQTAT